MRADQRVRELDVPGRGARRPAPSRCACTGPAYHTAARDRLRARLDRRAARGRRRRDRPCRRRRRRRPRLPGATDELGERNVVLFEWLAGDMPDADAHDLHARLPHARRGLGAHARPRARLDAARPASPASRWDYADHARRERPLGPVAGRPRAWAPRSSRCSGGSTPRCGGGSSVYGQGRDRFGLVHADIRLANLLVDGRARARDRLRRLRLVVVHVRLRDHRLVHRGPPRRARADAGLGRGLPLGGRARPRRRGRARRRS